MFVIARKRCSRTNLECLISTLQKFFFYQCVPATSVCNSNCYVLENCIAIKALCKTNKRSSYHTKLFVHLNRLHLFLLNSISIHLLFGLCSHVPK